MSREIRIPKAELEAWILHRTSELIGIPIGQFEYRIFLQNGPRGEPLDPIVDYEPMPEKKV